MLLLLSGPTAVGKSTIAKELINSYRFKTVRTGLYLTELARTRNLGTSRTDLQLIGDALDIETDYQWVVDVSAAAIGASFDRGNWIFDCVRKQRQVEHFRERYGRFVLHVYLTADESVLNERYNRRILLGDEYNGNTPYEIAGLHPNEIAARQLIGMADLAIKADIDTTQQTTHRIV
jgi:adenylosuccinate synthase